MLAETPREVVSLARDLMPDVVVLDFNIRGDDNGVKVAADLQRRKHSNCVPLRVHASDVTKHDMDIPLPFRYVARPFELHLLQQAIKELVPSDPQT